MLHDGEAETGAAFIPGSGGVGAIEPLEDPGQVLPYDSRTGVTDADRNSSVFTSAPAYDSAARWSVAHRVLQQVGQHLADRICIGVHRGGVTGHIDLEVERSSGVAVTELGPGFARHGSQVHRFPLRLPVPRFEP